MSGELTTCPYCGGTNVEFQIYAGKKGYVVCNDCDAFGPSNDCENGDKWNHRTPSDHIVDANKTVDDNPPLTLEELREMGGEPVWIEDWWQNFHGWELSDDASDYCSERDTKQYGKLWFAYRHKLEEE